MADADSSLDSPAGSPGMYTLEEQRTLIELAHRAIEAALDGKHVETTAPTPRLEEKRGAFTTLHLNGSLRGCVGYVEAIYPLYRTVAETAVAAAFYDSRFWPVTPQEAPELKIDISVLSVPRPIQPEEVEVGRHGLVVSHNGRRGLLLPQVPVEHGWDRDTFLAQTCLKAGLPVDAWQNGALLQGFTAEVFGEHEGRLPA